jgi:hypothetical protein
MNKDLLSGIVLIGVAAAYYLASTTIAVSSLEDDFGPHGLPNILAFALGFIGLLLAARGFWAARKVQVPAAVVETKEKNRPLRAFGLLAIGFGYILLIGYLGYAITIALLLVTVAWYEGAKLTWRLGVVAVGGAVFFWLIFVQLLDVAQPTGLLF